MEGANMKNSIKILIGLSILLLMLSTVTAADFDVDTLKTPIGYGNMKDGTAMLNDGNTQLYVGKMSSNEDAFKSDSNNNYLVTDAGNNIYSVSDDSLHIYGFQEKVNINGVDYLVSISKDKPLSNADKTLLKEDLEKFNKENNLEPIAA
jgi:hypothetical protein